MQYASVIFQTIGKKIKAEMRTYIRLELQSLGPAALTLLMTGCVMDRPGPKLDDIQPGLSTAKNSAEPFSAVAEQKQRGQELINKGVKLWQKEGKLLEAESALKEGLALRPSDSIGRLRLGQVLYAQHKDSEAYPLLGQAFEAKIATNDPLPWYAYAKLSRQKGFLEAEYKAYARILHDQPIFTVPISMDDKTGVDSESLVAVHLLVGRALEAKGKKEDAREEYMAAMDLAPRSGELQYSLAWNLASVGLKNEQIRYLRLAANSPEDSKYKHDAAKYLRQLGMDSPGKTTERSKVGVSFDASTGKWSHVDRR